MAEKDKKQKDLAAELGVLDNTVSYFVSGKRMPNTAQLLIIARFFGVTTDYLLGLTDISTTDKDFRFVCEYTGLSEYAVRVLNRENKLSIAVEPSKLWLDYIDFSVWYSDEFDAHEESITLLRYLKAQEELNNIEKQLSEITDIDENLHTIDELAIERMEKLELLDYLEYLFTRNAKDILLLFRQWKYRLDKNELAENRRKAKRIIDDTEEKRWDLYNDDTEEGGDPNAHNPET